MRSAHKFLTICTVVSILVCAFCIPAYADVITYIPACPAYPVAELLPFGVNNTVVIQCYKEWIIMYYPSGDFDIDQPDNTFVTALSKETSGLGQPAFFLGSYRPITKITETSTGYTSTTIGTDNGHSGFYTACYIPSSYSQIIYCNSPMMFMGLPAEPQENDIITACHNNFPSSTAYSKLHKGWHILSYPTTISEGIDSILAYCQSISADTAYIQAHLDSYYAAIDNKLSSMSSQISSLQSSVSSLSSQLGAIQSDVNNAASSNQAAVSSAAAANQSAVSSAAAENSSVVGQAASDIMNAGEGTTFNNDTSEVAGIISKLDEWNSELESFADDMDESISGVSTALDNGTTLFERFVGAAPAGLAALIAFALVWFVVRKIIGR